MGLLHINIYLWSCSHESHGVDKHIAKNNTHLNFAFTMICNIQCPVNVVSLKICNIQCPVNVVSLKICNIQCPVNVVSLKICNIQCPVNVVSMLFQSMLFLKNM